jgi:hypothetical protein
MSTTTSKIAALIGAFGLMAGFAASAHAETPWQYQHPRRTEVNERLANQNGRIDRDVARGTMSHAEGAYLHSEDRGIRAEERDMAAVNGGHITRAEQRTLNQQENAVSRQIGWY